MSSIFYTLLFFGGAGLVALWLWRWGKRKSFAAKAHHIRTVGYERLRQDSFTDEDYRRIYGNDEEAIREAKESWARAGERTIADTEKMLSKMEGDYYHEDNKYH